MYHDSLHLPVPATVRPIGMLGGGGASSKDGMSDGHRGRGGAQSQRGFTTTSAASSGAAASPAPATNGASPAATPSAASPNGLLTPTTTSTAGDVGTPLDRPTITIFTELDDGASSSGEDAMHNTSTAASPWVSGSCAGHGSAKDHAPMTIFRDPTASMACSASQRPPTALDPTETSLTPLHYRSLCSHPAGEDAPPSAYAFDPAAAMAASASSPAASPAPCFGRQTTEVTSGEERTSPSSPLPGVTARMMASTSSNFSHGQPMQPSAMGGGAWPSLGDTTPPDAHPVRLSATPVVPIVPYVAEPSCRRRVAEDLERLYGSSSRQSAAAAAATAAASSAVTADAGSGGVGVASTAGAEAGSLPLGGGAGAGVAQTTAEAAVKTNTLVPETPKKKKSGLSFLSSSASSSAAKKAEKAAKAAAAAEAKKKAAPPTAAERRQAREQVIRVGVQRLYQRLNELHLVVYHVKNDGNCQFRAISHQLFGNESYHDIIRSQVVSYMRTARAESFDFYFESPAHADAYYDNLAKLGSWGDELSLRAASDCLYVNIHVLSSEEQNCYITYRPSLDRAASAPSFLIDIAKLQERRRAERRLLRSHGLRGSATSFASFDHTHVSPTLLQRSATGGGDYNGFGGAATMPDTYGRSRCSAASAAAKAAPTLLVPASAACASRGGGSPHGAPPSSRPMSRNPSSVVGDFGDDDDEDAAAVDAHAIQLALHKKLQQSEIRCSLPLGATGACSLGTPTPTTVAGNGGMDHASMPLLQPQRSMLGGGSSNGNGGGGGGGPSLLQPMAVPVPRLLSGDEDLTQGPKANQTERFRAVGAEVQPLTDATQSVNIFTQRMENVPAGAVMDNDDYLRLRQTSSVGGGEPKCDVQPPLLTQPARPTLLRPQMSAFADAPPTGGAMTRGRPEPLLTAASAPYMSPPPHPHDEPGEMMLFASSSHRGRPYPSRQQSFSCMQTANSFGGYAGGSTYAESFNAHPVHGSFSQSFAGGGGNGGAYAQSLGNLVPVPASGCGGSLPCGAADAMEGQGGQAGYFKFEPRTEAIDIFLSYLYPVHYNSLSVSPQQQPQPQPQQAAVNASTALAAPPAPVCAATQESGTPLLTQQNLDGAITSARYLA